MKILYIGGQKSGKSKLAEQKALRMSSSKPFYVATYDNSYNDDAMQDRIDKHLIMREEKFITIEEAHNLKNIIEDNNTYLIDCISMWLFNNIEEKEETLKEQLRTICQINANIVFVLNDVNCGVIPFESQSRRFVDLSGLIGQELVSLCDEVYEARYGLQVKLK